MGDFSSMLKLGPKRSDTEQMLIEIFCLEQDAALTLETVKWLNSEEIAAYMDKKLESNPVWVTSRAVGSPVSRHPSLSNMIYVYLGGEHAQIPSLCLV